MKLCIAQKKPVTADIEANIQRHKQLIGHALEDSADVIIFPELSLTGYEPTMAKELACAPDDNRFAEFQRLTEEKGLVIGLVSPQKPLPVRLLAQSFFGQKIGGKSIQRIICIETRNHSSLAAKT